MKLTHLMLLTLTIPAAAQAHNGVDTTAGLLVGFMHPMHGWDHMFAMLAVGIWGAQLGGRPIWLLPLAFVGVMAASALLAMGGVATAYTEKGG
jgi:urease accessory protein